MNKKQTEHQQITLHKGHVILGIITLILILILYFFVDRMSSMSFNEVRHTKFYETFFIMQHSVNIMISIVPYAYIYLLIMLYLKRFFYFEQFLFASCTSLFFASCMTNTLKHIFGRYWTETFVDKNLSYIHNKTYGFDFFHGDIEHASFPSGHGTAIFAVMTILWIMYPKCKWIAVTWCTLVTVDLLGCNFHFPSDIVAGSFIGIISAFFILHASQLFARNLKEHKEQLSP